MAKIDEINTKYTARLDSVTKKLSDMLSNIDVVVSLRDKGFNVGTAYSGADNVNSLIVDGISPFDVICAVLKSTGKYDKIMEFIEKMLTTSLPNIELVVKMALLSNIKGLISCSSDPRIPLKLRKLSPNDGVGENNNAVDDDRGIELSVANVDFSNLLKVSPVSKEGLTKYFGFTENDTVYKSVRCDDFNAFMWYVLHRSSTPMANVLDDTVGVDGNKTVNELLKKYKCHLVTDDGKGDNLLETLHVQSDNENGGFIPGSILKRASSPQLSMCISSEYNKESKRLDNTFVPIGISSNSANWYIDRDGLDAFPICNLEYVDYIGTSSHDIYDPNNKFKFTVLPKPLILEPHILPPTRKGCVLLYNSKGEVDAEGHYTLAAKDIEELADGSTKITTVCGDVVTVKADGTYGNVNDRSLMECYPKFTVFEFNYDFVMGMKLFDAKVLTTRVLEMLCDATIGMRFDFIDNSTYNRIAEIVKSIVEADDMASSDCFFNFSNERYDEMMAEAEMSRYRRMSSKSYDNMTREYDLDKIASILSEYDEKSSLVEKTEVIKRAITEVNVMITEPQNRLDFQVGVQGSMEEIMGWNVLQELLEDLSLALVESILSPKVVLLLEVNRQLMRSNDEDLSIESFVRMNIGLIISIVKEIKDYILNELLRWVSRELNELITLFGAQLIIEQLNDYIRLFKLIKETCLPLLTGTEQTATMINVDYADIDNDETIIQPNCD